MSSYVDGFVLPVPKNKLAQYKKLATKAGKIWREHGALDYRECVGDDLAIPGLASFPKMAKCKRGEVVFFSFIIFRSRKHRDATNKKCLADPRLQAMCAESKNILDCKRMACGGFKTLVQV